MNRTMLRNRKLTWRNPFPILTLIAMALLLAACGGAAEEPAPAAEESSTAQEEEAANSAGELEEVRMSSWSQPIMEQSNLFLAEEKGWFEEAGIQFTYVPGAGGGDAVKHLLAGNADIAFANVEAVLLAAEQGAKLKIVYNIYPENVFNLVSLKEHGIESVEDLRGENVGVYSLSSGTYDNLRVLLYKAGMTEDDVNIIEAGVLNFAPLMNGQVKATAATDTGLFDARLSGLGDVDVIEVKEVLNTPSDVFVVTEEAFEEKKDLLIRFLQVYRDSVAYTMEHPQEAAELAAEHTLDGQQQDPERNLGIINIRNEASINDEMKEKGLGWLNIDILKEVEETYVNMGLLQDKVGIEEMVTNEWVEALD